MTNRLLALAAVGAIGAGTAATVASAHGDRGHVGVARAQIATVVSYTSGTLTLKTSGGQTVTGKVTRRTDIECAVLASTATTPTTPPTTPSGSTYGAGYGDHGGRGGDDRGGRGWGDDDENDDDTICDTSTLTAGQAVAGAETALTASGQKFTEVTLIVPASSSSSDNGSDY